MEVLRVDTMVSLIIKVIGINSGCESFGSLSLFLVKILYKNHNSQRTKVSPSIVGEGRKQIKNLRFVPTDWRGDARSQA